MKSWAYLAEPFDLDIFFFVSMIVNMSSPFVHIYGVIVVAYVKYAYSLVMLRLELVGVMIEFEPYSLF